MLRDRKKACLSFNYVHFFFIVYMFYLSSKELIGHVHCTLNFVNAQVFFPCWSTVKYFEVCALRISVKCLCIHFAASQVSSFDHVSPYFGSGNEVTVVMGVEMGFQAYSLLINCINRLWGLVTSDSLLAISSLMIG